MKLGGSTFSFMWQEPVLASLQRLKSIGLNDSDVMMVPGHLWFDDGHAALMSQMRRENLRIDSLNLPSLDLNICSVVKEVRDYAIETFLRTLDLADMLEARAIVVVPGRISGLFPPDHDQTITWLADGIAQLGERAERLGKIVLLESHPLTPVPRASDIGPFVEQFASPHIKIAYDVASAEFISEDQPEAIAYLGRNIGQFHLSDSPRTAWRHDAIGKGTVPIKAVLEAIEKTHKDTIAIVEIISSDPETDIRRSLSALAGQTAP